MQVQEHLSLAPFTTLGIGGPARWFVTASSEAEIEEAVRFAGEQGAPLFVLGGGSNLLVPDAGFPGVVLHIALPGLVAEPQGDGSVQVRCGAGESWDSFVQFSVERDLAGVECLAGIPGTVGGTPVQNVGAYGQEVAQTIVAVRCFDREAGHFLELSNADCGFAYRTSVLNTTARGRYVVVRVDFALRPGGAANLSYADLKRYFGDGATPSLAETAAAVREIRRRKSMVLDPADPNTRSAGSFFRNPVVSADLLSAVAAAAGVAEHEVPHWPAGNGFLKLPAAWLLERAGFVRGYAMGRAGISTRHTLALINQGGATAAEIMALRDRIVATVQDRFGVRLEQEPVLL